MLYFATAPLACPQIVSVSVMEPVAEDPTAATNRWCRTCLSPITVSKTENLLYPRRGTLAPRVSAGARSFVNTGFHGVYARWTLQKRKAVNQHRLCRQYQFCFRYSCCVSSARQEFCERERRRIREKQLLGDQKQQSLPIWQQVGGKVFLQNVPCSMSENRL